MNELRMLGPCEYTPDHQCPGTGELQPNPYDQDVNDTVTPEYLCDNAVRELIADI